jgi:hypothetical protein
MLCNRTAVLRMRKSGFHLDGIRTLRAGRLERVGPAGAQAPNQYAKFKGLNSPESPFLNWSLCRTFSRETVPAPGSRAPESLDLLNLLRPFLSSETVWRWKNLAHPCAGRKTKAPQTPSSHGTPLSNNPPPKTALHHRTFSSLLAQLPLVTRFVLPTVIHRTSDHVERYVLKSEPPERLVRRVPAIEASARLAQF